MQLVADVDFHSDGRSEGAIVSGIVWEIYCSRVHSFLIP